MPMNYRFLKEDELNISFKKNLPKLTYRPNYFTFSCNNFHFSIVLLIYSRWRQAWRSSEDYRTSWERNAYAQRPKCNNYNGNYLGPSILTMFILAFFYGFSSNFTYSYQDFYMAACNRNWYCSFQSIFVENVFREPWKLQGNV